jgi:hypothetical protein
MRALDVEGCGQASDNEVKGSWIASDAEEVVCDSEASPLMLDGPGSFCC